MRPRKAGLSDFIPESFFIVSFRASEGILEVVVGEDKEAWTRDATGRDAENLKLRGNPRSLFQLPVVYAHFEYSGSLPFTRTNIRAVYLGSSRLC